MSNLFKTYEFGNKEQNRQTGRTTRLIEEARNKKLLFVVHAHAFARFLRTKHPDMAQSIIVLTDEIERKLSGTKGAIVDHAVYELSAPSLIAQLKRVLYFCMPEDEQ